MFDILGIEEALRCAFCQARFGDVVRNVPCGEAICGDCHDRLEASKSFKCAACNRSHHKPKHGFAESKPLTRISKRPRVDHPAGVEAARARIEALRSFDAREHVSLLCEQLELEAVEAVESSVRALKTAEEDVLKRIREFRTQRLAALAEQGADEELDALARDFDRSNNSETDFEARIDALETQIKDRALGGQTALIEAPSIDPNSLKLRFVVRDKPKRIRIAETPAQTLVGHADLVLQTVFLPDERLASCSNDHSIRIWSLSDGAPIGPALLGHTAGVSALALLDDDRLASGSHDHTVKVWCLAERRELRTLSGHERAVVSLTTLSDGRLASYSCDNTIRIWRPLADQEQLLMTLTGHGNSRWILPIGRAQDDNLVTCSRGDSGVEASVLMVWSPREGRLVRAAATRFVNARALVVLSGGQVAVGFEGGAIELVDLADETRSRCSRADAFKWTLTALAELPDGSLASCGDDEEACAALTIKVWSVPDLELVQMVATGHRDAVECLRVAPDGRSLASASWDHTVKLWPLQQA